MTLAQWLAIVGLAMTFVGALWAASDLRPGEWSLRPDVMSARRHAIDVVDNARRRGYVSPPWPQHAVDEAMRKADIERRADLEKLAAEEVRAQLNDGSGKYRAARNGLFLVAVGSLLQMLAVFLVK